jgi:hypothetical protein
MANYEISGPIAYLKNHFREFVQVDFLDAKDAENGFEWPWDTWKNLFINITKVFFKTSKLWVLRVIWFFKHHFREFVQFAFLDAQDTENLFAWPFDTFIDFTNVAL